MQPLQSTLSYGPVPSTQHLGLKSVTVITQVMSRQLPPLLSNSSVLCLQPQSKQAVEDQIKGLALHIASMLSQMTQCEEAITSRAQTYATTQLDLKAQFAAVLLPLKEQLGLLQTSCVAPQVAETPAGCSSNNKRARTSESSPQTILVTSNNLNDVLDEMSACNSPATYDFQGREMTFTGEGGPTIGMAGVTWSR